MNAIGHNAVRVEPIMYGAKIFCSDECHCDAVVYFDERGPSVEHKGDRMSWEVWTAVSTVVADYRAKMEG